MYKSYQLSIITDDGIVTTRHCGIEGEVIDVVEDFWVRLKAVEDKDGLRKAFAEFIKSYAAKNPDKEKADMFSHALPDTDEINCGAEDQWYADFTLIRNLTDRNFDISGLCGKHKELCLCNGETLALNLGGFYAGSDEDIARRKLLAQLKDLKENLWDDNTEKNYSQLWNLCADYDNKQRDNLYLTDVIQEAEFVDEELLEDYFKNVLAKDFSLARIRHFLGDTRDDDIYRFDGYGNLANVDNDDFIEVIDNVEDKLIGAIEPELPRESESGGGEYAARAGGAEM